MRIPFPLFHVASRLTGHNPRLRHPPPLRIQPSTVPGRRENKIHNYRQQNCQRSQKYRNTLPRHQTTRLGLRALADTVVDQRCDDVHSRIGGAPDDESHRVLACSVPGCSHYEKSGIRGAFREALEEADNHQIRKILGEGHTEYKNALWTRSVLQNRASST